MIVPLSKRTKGNGTVDAMICRPRIRINIFRLTRVEENVSDILRLIFHRSNGRNPTRRPSAKFTCETSSKIRSGATRRRQNMKLSR